MPVVRGGDILLVLEFLPDLGVFLRDFGGLVLQFDAHTGEILHRAFVNLLCQAETFAEDGIVFQFLHLGFHQAQQVLLQNLLILLDPLLEPANDARDTAYRITRHDTAYASGYIANAGNKVGRSFEGCTERIIEQLCRFCRQRKPVGYFVALFPDGESTARTIYLIPCVNQSQQAAPGLFGFIRKGLDLFLCLFPLFIVYRAEPFLKLAPVVKPRGR